jgi:hypothetical protein
MSEWDGIERRHSSLSERAIWDELHAINLKLAHYEEERKEYKPRLDELLNILTVSKGLVVVMKTLIFIAAPLTALLYWVKEHVK